MPSPTTKAIRGLRLGTESPDDGERAPWADRLVTSWVCGNGHQFTVGFAVTADVPDTWDCNRCGQPATAPDPNQATPMVQRELIPAQRVAGAPTKTHLDQVHARRTPAERERLLQERLAQVRAARAAGVPVPPPTAD